MKDNGNFSARQPLLDETISIGQLPADHSTDLNEIEGNSELDGVFSPDCRYKLLREINRGGVGIIASAYDKLLRRKVAVKLLLNKYRNQSLVQKQFIEEALLTSRLQHPSIIPIYDWGYAMDRRPYFVMKLVAGETLSNLLSSETFRLDRVRLLKIFEQVCQSVSYAHCQDILHLDIKPANVMIGNFGEVWLMDWGQARTWKPGPSTAVPELDANARSDAIERISAPLGSGGTLAYMSPEQAQGSAVSPASDIFSLGALLCELLIGRPAYQASNFNSLLQNAMSGDTSEVVNQLVAASFDHQLVQLIKDCLAKHPQDRPVQAKKVAQAISEYLQTAVEQAESDRCRFFDLTLDMLCIASHAGYFVRVNNNFTRVLGYPETELISQPFLNFVHPDDQSSTLEVMQELLEGKPIIQFCNRYRHCDGSYRIFEWTAQALPNEGNIFAVARDVTHRQLPHFASST